VRDELRLNLIDKLRAGDDIFPGIVGFEETVVPQIQNAILSGQDMILLGERGQAKSRIIRSLTSLLDEWTPLLAGCEIPENPFEPITPLGRQIIAEQGDDAPIEWQHRDERYGEKLATPDITIADLIGEVDPIKVAEGRYLSDELTIHYGLVPRTNRGIFAINELPDLAERIQVGLLNVLEERDVQVRGYKVRLPLDVMLVASANPEDYTSRGRIITPLKDRFGSQIRTHYPLDVETEMAIAAQEARPLEAEGIRVAVPDYMSEIVATLSQLARESPHVNQASGVSVRLTVANAEVLVANATRRSLRLGEADVVPRICDLDALAASTSGKVEIETLEEGRDGEIIEKLLRSAVHATFRDRLDIEDLSGVLDAFEEARIVDAGEDIGSADYAGLLDEIPALKAPISRLTDDESPAAVAGAIEFILEGLHLSKRLNKESVAGRATYRGRG
jgi:magnesium chelatase subunit I